MQALRLTILYCATAFAALLGFELLVEEGYLGLPYNSSGELDRARMVELAAQRRGDTFDARTDLELILDERAVHPRVYPTISPAWYLDESGSKILTQGAPVLPLGINAQALSYYCNESGTFAKFETDRHGMRNPDSVWDNAATDVLVAGDSFAFGSCLALHESIVGRVRQRFPATINVGQGANGPLLTLAGVREYAVRRKARNVFWLFFENDLEDLNRERHNPLLRRYLQDGFTQNLIDRSGELGPLVDQAVELHFQRRLKLSLILQATSQKSILHLANIRGLLKATYKRLTAKSRSDVDLALFMRILEIARRDIERYGGKFTFVYLPDCDLENNFSLAWRLQLLRLLEQARFSVLDGRPAIARIGREAFYFCPGSHFAPAGAAAVAGLIVRRLEN